jgi:transmembrane sensor
MTSPGPHPRPGEPVTEKSALDWAVAHDAADQVFAEVGTQLRRRTRRRMAAAGCAVLLLAAGFVWQTRPGAPDAITPVEALNAVASAPARRVLPDGSVVELKDGAQITFDYSGPLRRVTLQKGEAHFAVAGNKQRPFIVEASGVEVRAVGTAFSVQLGSQAVEVLVTEGRVSVTPQAGLPEPAQADRVAPLPILTFVDAGSRCVVNLEQTAAPVAPLVAEVSPVELDERLAWRVPRLEFSGTPLGQAIPMFNQYARVKLVIDDPALESLELSGVLRADNTDSLLRLLETEFRIMAEPRGDEIVLRKAR